MTITEAINSAATLVRLHHYGPRQYKVDHWSATHNAWWDGTIEDKNSAYRTMHQCRIKLALELLGFDPTDAGAIASSCTYNVYPRDWRQCVREEIKADKLAADNQAA